MLPLRSLRRSDGVAVASNLVRERHAYKMSYEALQEMADIQKSGNFLHKIAFGILGIPSRALFCAVSAFPVRTWAFPSETPGGAAAAK